MKTINFKRLHAQQLYQLTGCRYAVLIELNRQLALRLPDRKRSIGRPFKQPIWVRLILALVKLRGEEAYRSLEVYLGMPHVTLQRYTNRICEMLALLPLYRQTQHTFLMVDGTCTRVRSSAQDDYSGYKHHKNRKVQMLVDDQRRILAVSPGYSGKVHDKTIWNKEFSSLAKLLDRPVLSDKAYAGATGENQVLLRPIKRNEKLYKEEKESSKAFNRELSHWRVTVEHVFAQLKAFKILRNLFPLQPKRYATCFKAIALVYNLNLDAKNARILKF
jgi:hypothetical protein